MEVLLKELKAEAEKIEKRKTTESLELKWREYRKFTEEHFREEETVELPLVRAFLTPKEVSVKIGEIMQKESSFVMGRFFHHMRGKRMAMEFMRQEKVPSFVWYVKFKGDRTHYRKHMESLIQQLLARKRSDVTLCHKIQLREAMQCGDYSWEVSWKWSS